MLTQFIDFIKFVFDLFVHLDVHLNDLVVMAGAWTYAVLFLVIFCETGLVVTPILPGDSLLFAVGALAAIDGSPLNIYLIGLLLFVAAVLGDACNYAIGKKVGYGVFKEGARFFKKEYLDMTHAFYEKHGGKTIIIARFAPIVRTFAPFVAGVGRMGYRKFASYNVIGAACWVLPLLSLGFYLGNLPTVKKNFHIVVVAIVFISILPAIIKLVQSRLAARRA